MTKRKAISTKARFEIFKRDRFVCQYCGAHPPHAVLHVDHIVPVVEGGDNDPTNLVTACDKCNLGKGPRSLTSVPESLKDKAARVSESEAQLRGYYKVMQAARDRREGDVWRVAEPLIAHFSRDGSIRKDRLQSIRMFVEKLDVYECLDAIERAIARRPYSETGCFRYFCGICWHKIKDEQT